MEIFFLKKNHFRVLYLYFNYMRIYILRKILPKILLDYYVYIHIEKHVIVIFFQEPRFSFFDPLPTLISCTLMILCQKPSHKYNSTKFQLNRMNDERTHKRGTHTHL